MLFSLTILSKRGLKTGGGGAVSLAVLLEALLCYALNSFSLSQSDSILSKIKYGVSIILELFGSVKKASVMVSFYCGGIVGSLCKEGLYKRNIIMMGTENFRCTRHHRLKDELKAACCRAVCSIYSSCPASSSQCGFPKTCSYGGLKKKSVDMSKKRTK